MDAVLPLAPSDLGRFELLEHSLHRFVSGLGTLWLVVPHASVGEIRAFVSERVRHQPTRVESELEWLPELARFSSVGGWYRQMLCKLAAARRVESDFYLTLDADVIATHRLDLDGLIELGRAPCAVDPRDLHPRWYGGVETLLGAPLVRRGISHNVTPTILSRHGVLALLAHLDESWAARRYARGFCGLKQRAARAMARLSGPRAASGWCTMLIASAPWAEYALYYSFLERQGLFETYHREVSQALYAVEDSVWFEGDFERWDPASSFAGEGAPYFVVVQSTARVDPVRLRERVTPFLESVSKP